MHEQMSWPMGSICLQKETVRTIANFKELFSLITTMTWRVILTYYLVNFSTKQEGKILSYFTDKKTEIQRS